MLAIISLDAQILPRYLLSLVEECFGLSVCFMLAINSLDAQILPLSTIGRGVPSGLSVCLLEVESRNVALLFLLWRDFFVFSLALSAGARMPQRVSCPELTKNGGGDVCDRCWLIQTLREGRKGRSDRARLAKSSRKGGGYRA